MSDPEIDAMLAVTEALSDLDEETRGRVLRWAAERYSVKLPASRAISPGVAPGDAADPDDAEEPEINGEGAAAQAQAARTFDHFADLFDAANPKTNDEKALVGAYWVQMVLGKAEFQTLTVNKELKQLGHGNAYINKAFDTLTKKKPALVLQTRKSGRTQQARKTYKLTAAGTKAVQRMLSNES